jgi:hypothetical protein
MAIILMITHTECQETGNRNRNFYYVSRTSDYPKAVFLDRVLGTHLKPFTEIIPKPLLTHSG